MTRQKNVVAFLRFSGAVLDRLDALRQHLLVGLERGRRRRGDDLALSRGDLRQFEVFAQVGFEHDIGEIPEHRNQFGDVHELREAGHRLVDAGRLQFEVGGRFAERGRPGVEFLDAALLEHFQLEKALDREHLAQRVGDRRARGGDQRAFAAAVQRQEAGFHIEVPGALGTVGIDAFQRALVGGEGELPEFLHLIDQDLIDAELGDGQHVVLAAFERFELGFDALLHALEPFERNAILRVDAV